MSLLAAAPFERLRNTRRVLIAGAGGGFDIYCGIPIALALRAAGVEVLLAKWLAGRGEPSTVYAFERSGFVLSQRPIAT